MIQSQILRQQSPVHQIRRLLRQRNFMVNDNLPKSFIKIKFPYEVYYAHIIWYILRLLYANLFCEAYMSILSPYSILKEAEMLNNWKVKLSENFLAI